MKRILTALVTTIALANCAPTGKSEQAVKAGSSPVVPSQPSNAVSPDIPVCLAPSILDINKEWSLPLQTYSANDFNTHVALKYCTSGSCNNNGLPAACSGVTVFNDFTVYSETSATFFNSITEPISVNVTKMEITLTSDTTNHKGMVFSYKFLKDSNEWQVMYSSNCGRLYQYALSNP